MNPQPTDKNKIVAALAGIVLLFVGMAAGYYFTAFSAPAPREPALLWDDYIIAVAALYQRDGDLEGAKQRLSRLSTSDAGASVAALAAIYVPDPRYGESASRALRDLAVALTGRPVPMATATAQASRPPAGPSFEGAADVARSPILWAIVLVGSLLWLVLARVGLKSASPGVAVAMPIANALALSPISTALPSAVVRRTTRVSPSLKDRFSQAVHPKKREKSTLETSTVSVTFSYDGHETSLEEMKPITDPLTGRMVAGCGLTNGPRAGGDNGGYVGFLVWLHELGSHELPQTLGLIADGSGQACKAAIGEWADYARLDELVVARPGVVRTFETRRLRAALSVSNLSQVKARKAKHKVFRRLAVRLDVGFKEESPYLPRTTSPTYPEGL